MPADHARHERALVEQLAAEALLAGAHSTQRQPIPTGNVESLDSMYARRIDIQFEQRVQHRVEHIEALMNRHFEDRRRQVK